MPRSSCACCRTGEAIPSYANGFGRQRHVHAPTLVDAEVTSAIRGLLLTSKPAIQITVERAEQMLDDFADLPLVWPAADRAR